MIKVLTDFSYKTDSDLATLAQHIIDCLIDNINFPQPVTPPINNLEQALTDYNAALAKATDGSKQDTALKNQKRTVVETTLQQLALYVQMNVNNDEVKALSSGFPLAKSSRVSVGPLPRPENLKVLPGAAGEILLTVNSVANASGYLWHYKNVTDAAWESKYTTKARLTVEALVSGQQYSFMVTALGSDSSQNWSNEVKSFVL